MCVLRYEETYREDMLQRRRKPLTEIKKDFNITFEERFSCMIEHECGNNVEIHVAITFSRLVKWGRTAIATSKAPVLGLLGRRVKMVVMTNPPTAAWDLSKLLLSNR